MQKVSDKERLLEELATLPRAVVFIEKVVTLPRAVVFIEKGGDSHGVNANFPRCLLTMQTKLYMHDKAHEVIEVGCLISPCQYIYACLCRLCQRSPLQSSPVHDSYPSLGNSCPPGPWGWCWLDLGEKAKLLLCHKMFLF